MKSVTCVAATYTPTGVRRFDGNPFIEALPELPQTKESLLLRLAHYPDKTTKITRQASEVVRVMELSTLSDIVYPFPDYGESALDLTKIIRESYVARNPFNATDIQRRHALSNNCLDGLPFPSDWKSTASGHIMVGITGSGKSTFANAFVLHYPQVINHTAFHGHPLTARQIVYITLSVPHDATLKGLCIQFFDEVDRILGDTEYSKVAKSVRTVALMAQLMNQVATAVSLGLIIIDDVQNLRSAKGAAGEYVLNLFSAIIERLGISLFLMATPAIDKVLINVVRNTRKSASSGCVPLLPMAKDSALWQDFTAAYWDGYTFTQKKKRLNKDIRDAWWDTSGGDTAFAVLSFSLTQQSAIGGVEEVDAQGFHRTMATTMAILQPAISALRGRKVANLQRFDDLLFGNPPRRLHFLSGRHGDRPSDCNPETPGGTDLVYLAIGAEPPAKFCTDPDSRALVIDAFGRHGFLREAAAVRQPAFIRSDNGAEFTAARVMRWLRDASIGPAFITPGSP